MLHYCNKSVRTERHMFRITRILLVVLIRETLHASSNASFGYLLPTYPNITIETTIEIKTIVTIVPSATVDFSK